MRDSPRRGLAGQPHTTPIGRSGRAHVAITGSFPHGTAADGTAVGVSLEDRLSNAHYLNSNSRGENAFAYATSVENSMKAFLIDWGNDPSVKPHLTNVMKPEYREIGIGIVNTSSKGLG